MGDGGDKLGNSDVVQQFEKDNPNIKINVTAIPWNVAHDKLITAVAGRQTPDITQLGTTWAGEFSKLNAADNDRAFLLNVLENLHREQLTGAERVRAIEQLAGTRLGVREISRRTGFNASTISRWLRIDRRADLKAAVQAGTLDISRASILVEAPRPAVAQLLARVRSLSLPELRAHVASLKLQHGPPATRGR